MAHASIGTFGIGLVIAMFANTAFGASTFASPQGSNTVLTLAQDGMTDYGIVIAQNADKRIVTASEELAHFLTTMTRAKFEVRRDDSPVSDFEIVLGETNRKMLEGVPPALRPKTWEGFAILSEGTSSSSSAARFPAEPSTACTTSSNGNWACAFSPPR